METINPIWDLFSGTFQLKAEVFQQISTFSGGLTLAVLVVLAAGLSLGVGQSIILFVNRVRPIRFIFSLFIGAVLYTFGSLFLVLSTWLICQLPWSVHVPLTTLTKILGLSYAPLLFSFLGALPYLGVPILNVLAIWHLLAMVVGFGAVTSISMNTAFGYVAVGWFVHLLLENTIGQPIARLGRTIADRVAGVTLAHSREEILQILRTGLQQAPSPIVTASQNSLLAIKQLLQPSEANSQPAPVATQSAHSAAIHSAATQSAATQSATRPSSTDPSRANQSSPHQPAPACTLKITGCNPADPLVRLTQRTRRVPEALRLLLGLLGMVVLFVLVALLLRPIRISLLGWYNTLPELLQFIFALVWIGIVAAIFAGLLAPLETLGWWAGWYGDAVDVAGPVSGLSESLNQTNDSVKRYVVYLDGIGQSGEEYTPDVEEFLCMLASVLPPDIKLVRGLMMYSVLNKPLDEDRPLAFLWRLADKMRWSNPAALLGILINLRNLLIVAVAADQRYGPIYSQGIAQVLYNGLIAQGYQPSSGMPVTLIGYSGGAQMSVAAAPYLRQAIEAPIDVISLGGVISANNNLLKLDHLYHLVGEQDSVERMGPLMFPGRWKLYPLSYWNRAKRKGKISIISLGPVAHQVPGGMMDPKALLPDGRTNLQQTVDVILQILNGTLLEAKQRFFQAPSNYQLYKQAAFNDPAYYPLEQTVDLRWYRPIGRWMGRLILPTPEQRSLIRGVLFEVHHADAGYADWVGQTVKLGWVDVPFIKNFVRVVTRDVHFSADAEYTSEYGGLIHPERLNHWRQVGPLESLVGSHPTDDLIVMLEGEVIVEPDAMLPTLRIRNQPVQITGRYYGLVQFLEAIEETDRFRVVHFNPVSRCFDGLTETVRMPPVIADQNGCFPSTTNQLERSPLNETGWYIYGAKDADGLFVVQAYAPRSLLRLQPDQVIFDRKQAYHYVRKQTWANIKAQKGKISTVLLSPPAQSNQTQSNQAAIDEWQEGDRALVLHTYGGIGGKKKEPAATTPIFFGHFAYGLARVVREPLADELRFEIQYYQVYTHNTDGLVAGTLHWSRYMGDRQFGWVGVRPVCDILVKLDAFTGDFETRGGKSSALDLMLRHLQVMTARYRIGDGTGGTYVGPSNNCSQDSNQALFASLSSLKRSVETQEDSIHSWLQQYPEQIDKYQQLVRLINALKRELQPLGTPRTDWEKNEYNLGCTLEDAPLRALWSGLISWRTLLPRLASDRVVRVFLRHNASVWVLRTNQIGGYDPQIEPIAPMTL